ncbi:LysR family transcriptional regulator [Streptomyces sp. KR80]|uniref:LysR family transcriptional regulator n=1 Tax=Streptomyces sp. KR80 TaxID=3457426 RepID=UPI003FD338F2
MVIEARHLRAVSAIAEAGSVTRAAAALGVSQPSLTGQLQRIERRIGGRLFVRDRQGVVPTPLGEFVLARARQVLSAMEELHYETMRYTEEGEQPRIRYGAVPGPLMAGTLRRLNEHFAGEVTLRTESSSNVLARLVAHRHLEFASVIDYEQCPLQFGPELECHVVAVEPAFALLPAADATATQREVQLAELADATWVLPPLDDNGLRECFTPLCRRAGFTPRVVHETEATGARDLISEGHCVGLGQATFRETAGIAIRPLAGSPLTVRHTLVWRRSEQIAQATRHVVAFATDAYAAAVGRSPAYLDWLARHPQFDGGGVLRRRPGEQVTSAGGASGTFRH